MMGIDPVATAPGSDPIYKDEMTARTGSLSNFFLKLSDLLLLLVALSAAFVTLIRSER